MITISTHVLDTSLGRPAAGIRVFLGKSTGLATDAGRGGENIGTAVTDVDGRAKDLQGAAKLVAGNYVLRFEVGPYFAKSHRDAFFDIVVIDFRIESDDQHYHVPVLLSPFGYSTYRGS